MRRGKLSNLTELARGGGGGRRGKLSNLTELARGGGRSEERQAIKPYYIDLPLRHQ